MNKKRWENFVKMTSPHKHIEELMEDCVFSLNMYQDFSEKVEENAKKLGPIGSYAWDEFVIEVTQRLFDDGKYNHELLDDVDEDDAEWIDMVCDVVCKLLEEKEFN
jgi:ribosome maturation protein Sdo1